MIAIPPEEWRVFHNMTFMELSQILKHLAGLAKLRAFCRHPRGPKIAQPKRTLSVNQKVFLQRAIASLSMLSPIGTDSSIDSVAPGVKMPK